VLDILFGSTDVEEILQQQLETAFPPSPSDPDYEQKFNEWIKRQSDSIISINHVPNAENPVFAGIRFPVPLPVSGPETIIPLFNQDGVYVGPGNLSEIFVGEDGVLTQVKEGVTQTIGRLTENGAAIFGEDGTIAQVIDLGEAVIDELGNVSYQPTDPNLMEGIDPETGLPTDDGGLPFDEEEDEEEVSANELAEGDSDLNGTDDLVDAQDIETQAYSGMFDNVPEDDRLAYLSDVEAAREEILNNLGTQLSDLGVDVVEIDRILGDVQQQLEGVATTEDLDALRTSLEGTISEELAALGIEDIQSTLTAVETDIDDLDTAISDLTTTVSELNDLSAEDVEGIVTDALADLENISEEDVTNIVSDIVDDLNNLGVEDVEDIVETALGSLEDLSETEVQDIVNDIVGSEADSTGLYGAIEDVSTQVSALDTDLNNRIDDLVAEGVARADAVDQALSELAIANDTTEANILAQIGTTEAALSGQISALDTDLNNRIDALVDAGVARADAVDQALAEIAAANDTNTETILAQIGTTEAALLGQIESTEEELTGQISALDTDLNNRIDDLVAQGVARADAVDQALSELAIANQTTEANILAQIGTTEAALTGQISGLADAVGAPAQVDEQGNIVADSTGIYAEIDALEAAGIERADAVDQVLSNLADQYDTNTETILNQIGTTEGLLRADISDVGADVEALAETVGQDTQYDDEGNVTSEATGIFAEFDNLVEQGANEYQALTTAISNVSDELGTTEETLFGEIADSENRLSEIIGRPSMSDDPNTPENEELPATGIYADIERSTTRAMAAAAGGRGGGPGYMGGLSYQLPGFVGVQYQPQDYTVELDRIINESLFGDMI
jgi:predicted chitinase